MTPIDHTADWRTRLTQAMEGVSEEDRRQLIVDAGGWFTCACGKLDVWIERDDDGEPADHELTMLGSEFYAEVGGGRYYNALTTLDAIEARARELKP